MYDLNSIYNVNALAGLNNLPDNFVDCCITSPPFYGLRDYGHPDQIGLEKTPEEYLEKLMLVFAQVHRVLKRNGTLWLNLGDSYCGTATGTGDQASSTLQGSKKTQIEAGKRPSKKPHGDIKAKDLMGIPWMVAFALREAGWYLRQDIIWAKPNPMPESVTDRCTKSHEYLFLLTKSSTYYFDADSIKTEAKNSKDDYRRITQQKEANKSNPDDYVNGLRPRKSGNIERKTGAERGCPEDSGSNVCSSVPWEGMKANKRSVWFINSIPYNEAHFATFPPDLIVDCIKAGCAIDGIVLDPFMGAGTTAMVARKLNRNFIGFELNPDYCKIANNRLVSELGMFL